MSNDDNEDLQSYMDTFDGEDEESDFLTLSAKAVENLAEVDAADDNTLFLNQEGYYYIASGNNATTSTKILAEKPSTSKKTTAAVVAATNNKATKPTSKQQVSGEDVIKYTYKVAQNDEDEEPTNEQVYEFTESLEGDNGAATNNINEISYVPRKTMHIKPDPNSDNGNIFTCTICPYSAKKRYLLSRHMRAHSDDRPFTCSVCERGFRTNASLLNHVNTHLGNKPHACKSCPMTFTTSGELVRHVRYRHTKEKPHKCSECNYSSVELSKLRRHIRCHTGERPYQCPHCTYASPDTFKLKRHMRTHTGEKPYECDICHSRFTQSNSLKAHRLIHSIGDKPIFQCALCPTTCGRKNDLRMHVQKLHSSDHPIKCKRCGKDLPDRYSYKVHLKTHVGEKCFRCSICPYASISQRHLESHMLIHTDQKPYSCETCNLAFRQRQLLKRHINLYHKDDYVRPEPREKIHNCPHCQQAFTHKGNLMRHMESHDPSSNAEINKWELKIGRMTRVQNDGSITILQSANEKMPIENDENVTSDDNIAIIGTNELGDDRLISYEDENDVCYEIIESIDEEEEAGTVDQKPEINKTLVFDEPSANSNEEYITDIKTVSIKKEPNGKEFMSVQVGDSQQYMLVEVIQCEEGEDEDEENCITVKHDATENLEIQQGNVNAANIQNCFGFQEDVEEDEYFENTNDSKDGIQLLHVIDQK